MGDENEYRPVRVTNIIAVFEQLAVKPVNLARSETSVTSRVRKKDIVHARRNVKSEVNTNRGLIICNNENEHSGNSEQSNSPNQEVYSRKPITFGDEIPKNSANSFSKQRTSVYENTPETESKHTQNFKPIKRSYSSGTLLNNQTARDSHNVHLRNNKNYAVVEFKHENFPPRIKPRTDDKQQPEQETVQRVRSFHNYDEVYESHEFKPQLGNSGVDAVDGERKYDSDSERRMKRLESIEEAEGDADVLATTKARAQAVLKKYEDEVLGELEGNIPYDLSPLHSDYSSILDTESEGSRSRNNSISVSECYDDTSGEYVCLRDVRRNLDADIDKYENVATLRKIVEDGRIAEHARTCSTYKAELIKNNSVRRHSAQKKRYLIDELIQTEVRYIHDLQFVIENYMEYISFHYNGDPMRRYKYIFNNIEMITLESKMLLQDITANREDYENIGKIFLNYKNLMDRYPVYCNNKKTSHKLIHGEYADIIEKRRIEIRDALGLSSYLLKPIQRLLRYEMFLRKLDKYLTREGADTTYVKRAVDLVNKTARRSNDLIVINSIEEMPHCLSYTGDFIMMDSFKMLFPKKMDVELFLFKKIIVFAVRKCAESFVYKTYIPLENLTKTSDRHKTTIILEDYYMKKRHKDPSFILDAMKMDVKVKWIEMIDKILWQQLREIREHVRDMNNL